MQAYTPKNYEEVPACLGRLTEKSKILGGGTDFIIRLNMGAVHPDALCYLGYIPEFKEIAETADGITIGAYSTMTQMQNNPSIRKHFPALMDAAADVGSLQIRNNGTIGGNLGNASPAGDIIPVLYLYHATIEVIGPNGTRMIPVTELIERPGKTTLAWNEAIAKIHLPYTSLTTAFVKLGTRKKVTISRIGVALGVHTTKDKVDDVSIIIGAISLRPVALEKAEAFLLGKPLNEPNISQVAEYLSELIMKITPKEFDRDYKIFASRGVIADAFEKLMR